jgi:hypothetical protein
LINATKTVLGIGVSGGRGDHFGDGLDLSIDTFIETPRKGKVEKCTKGSQYDSQYDYIPEGQFKPDIPKNHGSPFIM